MFLVDEIIIDERVAHTHFSCEVTKCKGACCTLPGGLGAPLADEEASELRRAFPKVKKYLPEHHLRAIEERGLYEGEPGNLTTTCVDKRACVFVLYEDGIARCSLEKAFLAGEITWRKPISCHLFPLRHSPSAGGSLRYEHIEECSPAIEAGAAGKIPLHDFVKPALVRKFGETWFDEFRRMCVHRDGASAPPPERRMT